ncbi:oxidoreductase [Planctomycetales bacterium]|nr:oxidoreductase [Planctomycetales bacterium]
MRHSTTSRRTFLKTTGLVSAGFAGISSVQTRNVHAAGSDVIKVALVGCGGRGLGSAFDRLAVGDNIKIVAVADVIRDVALRAADTLLTDERSKSKVDLPSERVFDGFNGYKSATDSADLVLIASPPAFHPDHYLYAVEKGKHVFIEKPFGVDAEGYRRCQKANKIAEEKNLTVCGGFQRRHEHRYQEWIKQIHDGKVGGVLSTRVYWAGPGAKVRGVRGEGEPEIRFQVRDWYFFNWLSGDHIVEQHCHNIDVGNWIHGKGDPLAHPVSCLGIGGRQVRKTPNVPYNECGNLFDHHYVEYTFADGSIMHSQCRQIPGCWNRVNEFVQGSKGRGGAHWLQPNGEDRWEAPRKKDSPSGYVQEHIDQADAIRNGKKLHDGWHSAAATMTAVMGWMATYSGREIKWDEAVAKGRTIFPYDKELTFETPAPILPGEDGTYEHAVAIPGRYNPFDE